MEVEGVSSGSSTLRGISSSPDPRRSERRLGPTRAAVARQDQRAPAAAPRPRISMRSVFGLGHDAQGGTVETAEPRADEDQRAESVGSPSEPIAGPAALEQRRPLVPASRRRADHPARPLRPATRRPEPRHASRHPRARGLRSAASRPWPASGLRGPAARVRTAPRYPRRARQALPRSPAHAPAPAPRRGEVGAIPRPGRVLAECESPAGSPTPRPPRSPGPRAPLARRSHLPGSRRAPPPARPAQRRRRATEGTARRSASPRPRDPRPPRTAGGSAAGARPRIEPWRARRSPRTRSGVRHAEPPESRGALARGGRGADPRAGGPRGRALGPVIDRRASPGAAVLEAHVSSPAGAAVLARAGEPERTVPTGAPVTAAISRRTSLPSRSRSVRRRAGSRAATGAPTPSARPASSRSSGEGPRSGWIERRRCVVHGRLLGPRTQATTRGPTLRAQAVLPQFPSARIRYVESLARPSNRRSFGARERASPGRDPRPLRARRVSRQASRNSRGPALAPGLERLLVATPDPLEQRPKSRPPGNGHRRDAAVPRACSLGAEPERPYFSWTVSPARPRSLPTLKRYFS